MKRWQPTTNRANAIRSRRRLSFEVCECRLALDGAGVAWIDLFASGSLTQANSGGLTYVFQNTTPQNAAQVPSSDLAVLADPDAEFLHADYADTDAPGIDVDDSVDGGFPRGGEPSVTTRYFLSLDQAYSSRGLAFPATDQAPGVPQLTRMFPARPIVRLQDPFDADPAAAAASSLEVATISIAGLFAGVPGVAVAEIPPSAAEQRGPVALRAVDDALPASEVLVVERPHSIVDAGRRQSCGVARLGLRRRCGGRRGDRSKARRRRRPRCASRRHPSQHAARAPRGVDFPDAKSRRSACRTLRRADG